MFLLPIAPRPLLVFLLAVSSSFALAQTPTVEKSKPVAPAEKEMPAPTAQPSDSEARSRRWLQSNELLVETPYTQERGEVQHTFTFGRTRFENWAARFTQEWPLFSEKHQLSISLPSQIGRNDENARGVGDAVLEYSYQLIGSNESRVTVTPRVGLSMPTGNAAQELGVGAPGLVVSVPVGVMLSPSVGTITSGSASLFGLTRNSAGETLRVKHFEVGQSFVWYARPRFNALLEAKWERAQAVESNGQRVRNDEVFIAPGLRWAHLVGNKLVLAPGISVPIGVGPSRRDRGILFSVAIEHSLGKRRD